jgi:hypothetical protein
VGCRHARIILQIRQLANLLGRFVDGQIELWHNPTRKGDEEKE